MEIHVERRTILAVVHRADSEPQAAERQARREQPHRQRGGYPLRAIDGAQDFRRRNRRAGRYRQHHTRDVVEEIEVGAGERFAVILQLAERRKRHAPGDAMQAVGHEAQQVPRHPIEAQRRTAEQPSQPAGSPRSRKARRRSGCPRRRPKSGQSHARLAWSASPRGKCGSAAQIAIACTVKRAARPPGRLQRRHPAPEHQQQRDHDKGHLRQDIRCRKRGEVKPAAQTRARDHGRGVEQNRKA